MAYSDNQILLFEKPVFSWYRLTLPLEGEIDLPSESCFAYILEGDDQDLTELGFSAKKGTVVLSLCGKTVGHVISKNQTGFISAIIVHFNRDTLEKVFKGEKPKFWKELDSPLRRDTVQLDASALLSSYFLNVADFFDHKNALSEDILSLKLKEVILLLLQAQESSVLTAISRSLFSEKTFSFSEVIKANLFEPLNLDRLAAMTNNSLASFKRKFKKIYNESPAKYIRLKKLEKGKMLLMHSQKSIGEIGYECGISDPSSFSRMFKGQYHISPTEFRLSHNA